MLKNKKKSSLMIGSIIVFLIVITPYLLYFYQSVPVLHPDDPYLPEDWETFIGAVKGGHYVKAQNYVYYFFSKFVPLMLLIIWFITNKHWWVHAILIPISVYLFQLIAVINDSIQYVDTVEFIYTVPIAAVIIAILYFLRSKMSLYIKAMDLKKEMDQKMNTPKKFG